MTGPSKRVGLVVALERPDAGGVARAGGAYGPSTSGGGVGRYSTDGRRPDGDLGESGGIDVGVLIVGDAGCACDVRTVVVVVVVVLLIVNPARLLWIVCGVTGGG